MGSAFSSAHNHHFTCRGVKRTGEEVNKIAKRVGGGASQGERWEKRDEPCNGRSGVTMVTHTVSKTVWGVKELVQTL